MSASTSCNERGERLLREILRGHPPDIALARSLARDGCTDALFRIVVEGLADRFELRLCEVYALLFSEVLAEVFPDLNAEALLQRYNRVRVPRICTADPERVCVLSRVTLGADIAVTSVFLNAAKARFPKARIFFVGSGRNAELFPHMEHLTAPYPRTGSLRERLAASRALATQLSKPGSIVLDPDSRLTQLGLLPVCREENYFFFESRGFGGTGTLTLSELAAQWCGQVLGVAAAPSLPFRPSERKGIALSFGVGENPAKGLGPDFEAGLLASLPGNVLIDRGAGGEEGGRVDRAILASGSKAKSWNGSFAGFARQIAGSALYVGYDSAGQHAAAALGVPLVAVFSGHVSQRMFDRWKPAGAGPIAIINAEKLNANEALRQTLGAIKRLLSEGTFEDPNENHEERSVLPG